MSSISIIDFQNYSLDKANPEDLTDLAKKLCKSLEEIGFCYLTNHGISPALVSKAMDSSKEVFLRSEEEKNKFAKTQESYHGYVGLETEKLNLRVKGLAKDYKEAYNYTPGDGKMAEEWPSVEFQTSIKTMYEQCSTLANRVLDVIAVGLKLENGNVLREAHQHIGKPGNKTTIRSLFYPAIPKDYEVKEGQFRCGEHSDYGTITLLFQDKIGGLQVKSRDGKYIDATPIPDTIVLNIGTMLQRWTADRLKATDHRILFPEDQAQRTQNRQSIAFFATADDDVIIECLDKSNKYPPIKAIEFLGQQFYPTFE